MKKGEEEKKSKDTETPKRGKGQPTLYKKGLALIICKRMSDGESLRSICREKGMPDHSTVLGWLYDEKVGAEFRPMYDHAREKQADVIFEQTVEIADNATADILIR